MNRKDLLQKSKRIVVKVGTTVVTRKHDGRLALGVLGSLTEQCRDLIREGREVILVSSGAVGLGKQKFEHWSNAGNSESHSILTKEKRKRAYAAAGQSALMSLYDSNFGQLGVKCAQVLVTDSDFSNGTLRSQLRSTLDYLLEHGIVPIVNENDAITTRSVPLEDSTGRVFWDNDSLAALIARESGAHLLVLLTDVDGLYTGPPDQAGSQRIETFGEHELESISWGEKSREGTGGMTAKVDAAISAMKAGIVVVIAKGKDPHTLSRVVDGQGVGTLFTPVPLSGASARQKAVAARRAGRLLASLPDKERVNILHRIADLLLQRKDAIYRANELDMQAAVSSNVEPHLVARLKLDDKKLKTLADGIRKIGDMDDPIGRVLRRTEISEGQVLQQETSPLGLIMVIFESRPDVLPQVAALAIRTGNGLVLKGGKEAAHSNRELHNIVIEGLMGKVPPEVVTLEESRESIYSLLNIHDVVDLVIPRGSSSMVRFIQNKTRIPVMGHAEGICHMYIDQHADLEKACKIAHDAKTDYPAACNALETILFHEKLVQNGAAKKVLDVLNKDGVELFGGPLASDVFKIPRVASLSTEYGRLAISVEIVKGVDEAMEHIHTYGSGHTEVIITEDATTADRFMGMVDSACVFHNCSSRFSDGYRFGLGAEVGISTSRIHARGVVGIDGLLTTKWKMYGSDHTVKDFTEGKKVYTHKPIAVPSKL